MQKPNHVLLTGATGCLGNRILDGLLKEGYHVRATARLSKVHSLKEAFPNAGDNLEIIEMQDLLTGDWKKALEGIDAMIHTAAPIPYPGVTGQEIYDTATIGMQRVLDAAGESPTLKRFIYTCSVGAFFKLDFSNVFQDITFDENTFSELEDMNVGSNTDPDQQESASLPPYIIYLGTKAISEKMMWKAAEKFPHIDFTSMIVSCVYGKFLDNYPFPTKESDLNVNTHIYFLISKNGPFPPAPMICQVHTKDNARAHILALTAKKLEDGRKKRLIIASDDMHWAEAVNFLKEKRPELRDRLPDLSSQSIPPHYFKLDTKMTEEVLGMKRENMIAWKDTLLEVVDWVVDWEKKAGIQT